METVFWLIAFVLLLLIEFLTLGLTTIWFAGGALAAWVLAMLHCSFPAQVIAFLLISILLLLLTRPIAMKHFNRKCEKTNVERLIGQSAAVLEEIDEIHGTGKVLLNGIEWSAKAKNPGEKIGKDTIVQIDEIQGVKVVVTKKEDM